MGNTPTPAEFTRRKRSDSCQVCACHPSPPTPFFFSHLWTQRHRRLAGGPGPRPPWTLRRQASGRAEAWSGPQGWCHRPGARGVLTPNCVGAPSCFLFFGAGGLVLTAPLLQAVGPCATAKSASSLPSPFACCPCSVTVFDVLGPGLGVASESRPPLRFSPLLVVCARSGWTVLFRCGGFLRPCAPNRRSPSSTAPSSPFTGPSSWFCLYLTCLAPLFLCVVRAFTGEAKAEGLEALLVSWRRASPSDLTD